MSEWNRALRMASRLLQAQADSLPPSERGQPGNYVPHPDRKGLMNGRRIVQALIEPEGEQDDRIL